MNGKLNALALGYAGAITPAFGMFLLGIAGNIGIYEGAVKMMEEWHMFFSLSIGGIIAGMFEAGIIGFIFTYVFGWVYNKILPNK